MESSSCMGLMAVVAISSSIAIVSLQVHKRLVSDFMKKVQFELSGRPTTGKIAKRSKKKVRFAADVVEPSSNNEEYRRRRANPRLMMANGQVHLSSKKWI